MSEKNQRNKKLKDKINTLLELYRNNVYMKETLVNLILKSKDASTEIKKIEDKVLQSIKQLVNNKSFIDFINKETTKYLKKVVFDILDNSKKIEKEVTKIVEKVTSEHLNSNINKYIDKIAADSSIKMVFVDKMHENLHNDIKINELIYDRTYEYVLNTFDANKYKDDIYDVIDTCYENIIYELEDSDNIRNNINSKINEAIDQKIGEKVNKLLE